MTNARSVAVGLIAMLVTAVLSWLRTRQLSTDEVLGSFAAGIGASIGAHLWSTRVSSQKEDR